MPEYVGGIELLNDDDTVFASMMARLHAVQERPAGLSGPPGLWRWWGELWIPEEDEPVVVFPPRTVRCRLENGREGTLLIDAIDTVAGLGTRRRPALVKGSSTPPFI